MGDNYLDEYRPYKDLPRCRGDSSNNACEVVAKLLQLIEKLVVCKQLMELMLLLLLLSHRNSQGSILTLGTILKLFVPWSGVLMSSEALLPIDLSQRVRNRRLEVRGPTERATVHFVGATR